VVAADAGLMQIQLWEDTVLRCATAALWSMTNKVSATRTPSCKDSRRNAMLRHDQALKEGLDEVAKAGFRAVT
jgi:hypothetical protein